MTEAWMYPERERGAGDHDVPYRFGKHPSIYLHVREFARLLVWRGRLEHRLQLRNRSGNYQPEAQTTTDD